MNERNTVYPNDKNPRTVLWKEIISGIRKARVTVKGVSVNAPVIPGAAAAVGTSTGAGMGRGRE